MASSVVWVFFICLNIASCQILRQYKNTTLRNQGICKSKTCPNLRIFKAYYKDCIVVLGTLQLTLWEFQKPMDFMNVSFPNLREVTEFVVVYRVTGLRSLGQLFPNLARIRGEKLLNNYGLIVHDMEDLREIGLYGLLKVDRGGIIVWGVQQACFIDTVDWRAIVPLSRLVISLQDRLAHCNFPCTCTTNSTTNHCWNNMKCQIYLEGPEADKCNDQCLGCRKTRSDECSLCRYYTHNGRCVSKCPLNTIVLPNNQYCITIEECHDLDGWLWNGTCVFNCPLDYEEKNTEAGTICQHTSRFNKTCENLVLWAVANAQDAEGCVYINGVLEIHIRPVPEVMTELRAYLNRIEEVSDYVVIYGSSTITTLDFLSSLKRIKGQNLRNGKYSLIIYEMDNLHKLFTQNVTQNLKIDRGTLKIYNNPVLCISQIDAIKPLFPVEPNNDTDIPTGMNGYSGGCEDGVSFQIRIINETSAMIMFSMLPDPDAHYSVLYVRLPAGMDQTLVPETCSESEWYAVNAETSFGHQFGIVELTSLRPASKYAICIETYDPVHKILARSTITHFTTPVGRPEPPFIMELAARNSAAVVISWVNHKDYHPFITHYELDVSLLEIFEKDIAVKNQCKYFEYAEFDITRHAVVMRPPPEYARGCESNCGVLTTVTVGAMMEEHFDVCNIIGCDNVENEIPGDTFFGKFVKTLILRNLTISETKKPLKSKLQSKFQVGGLAPFRDYRFRLRACTNLKCSRSARGVVRTLSLQSADVPSIALVNADEHGSITVKWDPPEITNGPILSYTVEVIPKIDKSINRLLPQTWCVLANETSHTVKSVLAKNYSVRVCSRSWASNGACTEWKPVEATIILSTPTWWWTGVIFAVCLYIASIVAGYVVRRRSSSIDQQAIVDFSTSVDESEPPSKMFSDFAPLYEIPLRDTRLE